MLLGSAYSKLGGLGGAPSRSYLRMVLAAATAFVVCGFVWTAGGGGAPLSGVMTAWPASIASHMGGSESSAGIVAGSSASSASSATAAAPAAPATPADAETKPPLFVLVGDSTTNGQLHDGGGWGDSFIWLLARGAEGTNHGINGALSTGYYHSPMFADIISKVQSSVLERRVYVTIQFGHNDQNPNSNVTLDMYEAALAGMARDVIAAGGTPVLVTPLARRDFALDGVTVVDNLAEQRAATHRAHDTVVADQPVDAPNRARLIDLNAASLAYIAAIGRAAAFRFNKYNPFFADTTHLNEHGAYVFSRIVADLLLGHPPKLVPSGHRDPWAPGRGNDDDGLSAWIEPNPYLTGLVWHGDAT